MTYEADRPADILEEDKIVEVYPVPISLDNVEIVSYDQVFG